jgi:hypothetical protein
MEILTDIPLTQTEVKFYKKFKNLSVNERAMPQGEGTVRISPFDDYVIFTLYDEIGGVDSPIDLSNVGTIYMVFIGKTDEIRIPNYTNVQNVDLSAGQVLFRIDKNNSQKILALDNRNFYISTMMTDPDGNSDESVIYTGTFLSFVESAKVSLVQQLEADRIEYSKQLALLQATIDKLNQEINQKDTVISQQIAVIETIKESNQNLSNEIAVLAERTPSSKTEVLLDEAKGAQKAEEEAKLTRQQITSELSGLSGIDNIKKSFVKQAATLLRSNIPSVTRITPGVSVAGVAGTGAGAGTGGPDQGNGIGSGDSPIIAGGIDQFFEP